LKTVANEKQLLENSYQKYYGSTIFTENLVSQTQLVLDVFSRGRETEEFDLKQSK